MMFCGVFDGHGPWGHFVAKRVRKLIPALLLCNWQKNLAAASIDLDLKMETDKNIHGLDLWKQSCIKTFAAVDQDLKQHTGIDSFQSGTTALTIIKQVIYLYSCNLLFSAIDTYLNLENVGPTTWSMFNYYCSIANFSVQRVARVVGY